MRHRSDSGLQVLKNTLQCSYKIGEVSLRYPVSYDLYYFQSAFSYGHHQRLQACRNILCFQIKISPFEPSVPLTNGTLIHGTISINGTYLFAVCAVFPFRKNLFLYFIFTFYHKNIENTQFTNRKIRCNVTLQNMYITFFSQV